MLRMNIKAAKTTGNDCEAAPATVGRTSVRKVYLQQDARMQGSTMGKGGEIIESPDKDDYGSPSDLGSGICRL
ncbi:hypothetical protein GCM10010911_31770 [Paenibacillus nasutitermitis]|uniref:Uncharacterized protein n=1 Tax=Paenibacillus nasutitermitis TaxID=1652958 RepID=A0A917DV54_9BACL|nr:hypothetical protein GCM10010911_31770 [Paenibacillus nasutitermitis]